MDGEGETVDVSVDTHQLDSATIDAHIATNEAEAAADEARIAAASAAGATIAQGQLIDQVTQYAREDAQRETAHAAESAAEAQSAAEAAVAVNTVTIDMINELGARLAAIETRQMESAPSTPPSEQVTEISGEEQGEPPPEESENPPAEQKTPASRRRRHGRKGRMR